MINSRGFLLVAVISMLFGCAQRTGNAGEEAGQDAHKPSFDTSQVPGSDLAAVVEGNNAFAFDLYSRLKSGKGNVFFSPFSISAAFAMARAGARGETDAEIAKVMRFDLPQDRFHPAWCALILKLAQGKENKGHRFEVANALWGQQSFPFRESFFDQTRKFHGTELQRADFSSDPDGACRRINAWVEKKTQEKIRDLFLPGALTPLTRLVLVNAVYFQGTWAHEFDKDDTLSGPFTTSDGKEVKAQFMRATRHYRFGEFDGAKVIELPYLGNMVRMLIVLPKKPEAFVATEAALCAARLREWTAALRSQEIDVAIPRFSLTQEMSLDRILADMGMPSAFSPDKADFSGMQDGGDPLFFDVVVHKAFVEVNEKGTEAAAATGTVLGIESKPLSFRADRPFLFFIIERETGTILFAGRLENPTK